MVGVTKIGARNAAYWINAVREGGDDYYTKPGEAPGEWMGKLAAELGLSGEVDSEDYGAVLAGKHPGTGQVLVARPQPRTYVDAQGRERKVEPTLGYDVRFSAPKSVSILWAVGPDEVRDAVLRAHDKAVAEGLAYLERTACWVRRGHGGAKYEPGTGFVGMAFLHRSSRAGDPALHTHLLVSNMTRASSDGRWLSIASPKRRLPLLREAKAAGHVYQAALRAGITRELGMEWAQPHNGYADLAEIGRPVIEHFSRRRAEILAAMAERGVSSAAAAEVAAYRTRASKDYGVDTDTQRAEWIARAAEFDLTASKVEGLARASRTREPRQIASSDLDAALSDLEVRHSHFDRRDLLCALASRLPEGADGAALEAGLGQLLRSERLVEIHRGTEPLASTYYTTARLWELEQRVIRSAREGREAGAAVVDERTLAAVFARHRYLSGEQVEMVRRLATGGERIVAVAALPGAGKTTALRAAREAWAAAGVRGIGVATARSASGELAENAGVPSTSVTDFLIRTASRAERGLPPLPPGVVVFLDEATATPTPDLAQLVSRVEGCDGKLVMIGDPNQIGAVGPGGVYGHLTDEHEPIVLREIRRQHDPADRRIVELAHEGRGSDALDLLHAHERFLIADTLDEALDAQALDWHRSFAASEDAVMIARRNWDVAALNERARELRREHGELGEGVEVAGQEFNVGDRIITRVNTPEVSNRERWDVIDVDVAKGGLTLRRVGEAEGRAILDRAYLAERTPSGEPPIQHAYAITTYAAQSKTFESAFTFLDAGISREDFVVAVSRSSGHTRAYGVAAGELLDADLGPAKREVEDPAHDIRSGAERVAEEYPAAQVHIRKRLEALSPVELARRRAELERRLGGEREPPPQAERLARLEKRISDGKERVAALRRDRDALLSQRRPDREQLAQLDSAIHHSEQRLTQLAGERSQLAVSAAAEPRTAPPTSRDRLELTLIEEQMTRLYRRQVALERLHPSEMTLNTLGPRPKDPFKAVEWDAGIDLIHSYRQRHGITSPSGHPLGPKTGDAARRRERQLAQQRLMRIQQRLSKERVRKVERALRLFR
jgi:conjugative relaxase-like TrwC/TraI family protein